MQIGEQKKLNIKSVIQYIIKNPRKEKFGMKYLPYYRIIEKKGPVSFLLKVN